MRQLPTCPEQTRSLLSVTDTTIRYEREALEQRRAELVCALAAAEQSIKTFLPGSLEHGKAHARVARLQNELRLIKGKSGVVKKHHDLGDLLIAVCRERATPSEWKCIVAEARRRHGVHEPVYRQTETTQSNSE